VSKRVSQEEWDERAAAVGLRWVGDVASSQARSPAACTSCGYEWNAHPQVVTGGGGCPSCAGHAPVSQDEWDERAAVVGVEWLEPVAGARALTASRCRVCGHEWMVMPDSVRAGHGCAVCAGNAPVGQEEWNRRAAAVGVDWLDSVAGNSVLTRAKCRACGHQWAARPSDVDRGGRCPVCANKRKGQYQVHTQAEWAEIAECSNLEWCETVTGALTKTRARCTVCKHEWHVVPSSVQQGRGCPQCAEYGFKSAEPALLYLLVKDDGVAKVGITGDKIKTRMASHKRNGYRLVDTWSFGVGKDAREVEQAVIRRWREDDDLLPAAAEGEHGWIETVHTDGLPLEEIIKRLNKLAREQPSYTGHR